MTEEQTYHLARQVRWLRTLIVQIEEDYRSLVAAKLVVDVPGITGFESIPVFLDMADKVSADVQHLTARLEASLNGETPVACEGPKEVN